LNVRGAFIREDHLARLSFAYAPYLGESRSETLEDESLAVFETRYGVPYFYDSFASGPRGVLVTGEPRRGKTFAVAFLVDHEAKYGGYIFIYDIGGAYENVVLKHGGVVVKVGLAGPRLNPFSLPNTQQNRNETARLVMMLLERGGARLRPQDETGIRASVRAIYELERPEMRRLRYLILSPELQPYLAKWIGDGIYGRVFDNAEDDLHLSHLVSFDFEGLSSEDQKVLMQPLLFWIRLRIGALISAEEHLDKPKLEIYDEVWRLIQDPNVLAGIFSALKTYGKKLGGVMLATQSTKDLGPHAEVIRNACPDALFLGGAFNRQTYEELFEMNANQLDIIPTLARGEILILRKKRGVGNYAKVIQLTVDEKSKWLYSTHPQDVRRRAAALREHGREKAFDILAVSTAAKN
jgi:type IV secretion system protein VirB4